MPSRNGVGSAPLRPHLGPPDSSSQARHTRSSAAIQAAHGMYGQMKRSSLALNCSTSELEERPHKSLRMACDMLQRLERKVGARVERTILTLPRLDLLQDPPLEILDG